MISVKTDVYYTQAYGCFFCLHIWMMAIYFLPGLKRYGHRLELFTHDRTIRWSWGKKHK